MSESKEFVKAVRGSLHSEHDTLYVNESQFRTLKKHVATPGLRASQIDTVSMFGVDIVVIETLDTAILCKRGDVFPLAKDFYE